MRRCFSLFLCGVLLLGTMGLGAAAAEHPARKVPETKRIAAAEGFAGGDGTREDPYQIETAAQLVRMGKLEEEGKSIAQEPEPVYYVLTKDIALNDTEDFDTWDRKAPDYGWDPMPMESHFDGQGHTISGLYLDLHLEKNDMDREFGLFSRVQGEIRNLKLEKSFLRVTGGTSSLGSIAGALSQKALIENCSSDAVILSNAGHAGGIAGQIIGDRSMVKDCLFAGSLSGDDTAYSAIGGILGGYGQVLGCKNLGTISGSDIAGGIVGRAQIVKDCENHGEVTGENAGGIAGNLYETATNVELSYEETMISGCRNYGTVQSREKAGGIVANMCNDESDVFMYVGDCENYGRISGQEQSSGIAARLSLGRGMVTIRDCANEGEILCNNIGGGVIGELFNGIQGPRCEMTVEQCRNTGPVRGEGFYSGGIIGYWLHSGAKADFQGTIESCRNDGEITCQKWAGGILGFNTSAMLTIQKISRDTEIRIRDCVNTGSILVRSSNSFAGGIVSNWGGARIPTTIEDCVNTGDVTVDYGLTEQQIEDLQKEQCFTLSQITGGIVGMVGDGLMLSIDGNETQEKNINGRKGYLTIRNCFSSGEMQTPEALEGLREAHGHLVYRNFAGGIVGQASGEDNFSFRVENCGYAGENRGFGDPDYPDFGQKISPEKIEKMAEK